MTRVRTLEEMQEDIRTLRRVPSEFIDLKLNELAEELAEHDKQIREQLIAELVRPLQNRCYALTQGQMCFFCPMECEHRNTKFINDEQLKEQNKC